jgi:phosphate/sulfate permease
MSEQQHMEQAPGAPNPSQPSTAGKGLGIAGFVLGIVAIVLSFVPCFGMYALFPGIVGIALSAVSINQASKANAAKGLAIAGLVCSILATFIAYGQYSATKKAVNEFDKGMKDASEKIKEAGEKYERDMKEANEKYQQDMEALKEKYK